MRSRITWSLILPLFASILLVQASPASALPREASLLEEQHATASLVETSGGLTPGIDWSQPPVGCVEELVLQESPWPCPDLSGLQDPTKDIPASWTPAETALWTGERAKALAWCRSKEVLRREEDRPGSFSPGVLERNWMRVEGSSRSAEKIQSIYDASEAHGVPPHILVGALTQESLLADLGVSDDGGNYSCGIAQLNVLEWCNWAERQPPSIQNQFEWPAAEAEAWKQAQNAQTVCSEPLLQTRLIRPFHRIGLSRLNGLPSFRLGPQHMAGIRLEDVQGDFPPASASEQELRFKIARAFLQNCSSFASAIPAKANQLKILFETQVPPAAREVQSYAKGETWNRSCQRPYPTQAFPLHFGWLLADAIYNAGQKIVTNAAWYFRLTPQSFDSPATWAPLIGQDLITALYWGGKYNPKTDYLEFKDFNGTLEKITFFKSCIVQRHVARVIQYATLPGYQLALSLEDKNGCAKSIFDSNGNLVQSKVPLERRKSTGRKPLRRFR